ncbi:Nadrin-like protein [Schistosoma mansoni]|uniref:Nadrin-like protein n=1 Tax=Schistosoma mansoni TaxID=6183 RepID=UPI00022DC972|nr:Nadrin-like protein [Schistosoma mansoni]|eukprot:XP_018647712.1 Nadrin-like protein [Schistosoma mansoni]
MFNFNVHNVVENPFKKLAQLKKVKCSDELSSAFRKPKAQALDLRRLERELENRGRSAAGVDVEETENLYSRVQSQLRTNRRSSVPPRTPPPPQSQPQNIQPNNVQYQKQTTAPNTQQYQAQQHQQQNFQPPAMQKPTPRPQFQAPIPPPPHQQQPNTTVVRLNASPNQRPDQPSPPIQMLQPLTISPPGQTQTPVESPRNVPPSAQPTPPPPPPPPSMAPAAQNVTLPPPPSTPLMSPPIVNSSD